jgi:hypothetical protein
MLAAKLPRPGWVSFASSWRSEELYSLASAVPDSVAAPVSPGAASRPWWPNKPSADLLPYCIESLVAEVQDQG